MTLATVEEALNDFHDGKFVIIVDDEDRENEGDLAIAAEKVTADAINFMAKYGRGLICLPIIGERLDGLQIPMMVQDQDNNSRFGTAFTVSVDASKGATTGISAHDRAVTVKAILDSKTGPEDLVRPGHLFPLRYREGGVLVRTGQTEAAVDLAKLAGLYPAAVICEVMNEDGTMARMPQLAEFSQAHGVKIISVAQLIEYRRRHEKLIRRMAEATIPTEYGEFSVISYEDTINKRQHLALILGNVTDSGAVLVRVHSECITGDVFGSQRCDCGFQLRRAVQLIGGEGRGVILYLRQEGRGIGLHNKLKAYSLQDQGLDTVEANERLGFPPDLREYGIGAQILVDLGLKEIRVMTNNPKKLVGLRGFGLTLVERVPLQVKATPYNLRYLRTKQAKLGHIMSLEEEADASTL